MTGYKGTVFEYNNKGCQETGFDNYIDHQLFGHPSNPEYQELCQSAELNDRFESWMSYEIKGDVKKACDNLGIELTDDMNVIFEAFANPNNKESEFF